MGENTRNQGRIAENQGWNAGNQSGNAGNGVGMRRIRVEMRGMGVGMRGIRVILLEKLRAFVLDASAKIPRCEGSISPSSFYGQLADN